MDENASAFGESEEGVFVDDNVRIFRGAAGKSILHHPAHNSLRKLLCFCYYFLRFHLSLKCTTVFPFPLFLSFYSYRGRVGAFSFPPSAMNEVVSGDQFSRPTFDLGLFYGLYICWKAHRPMLISTNSSNTASEERINPAFH